MGISHWKRKLTVTAVYLGILAVLYMLQVPCIFQSLLNIPCPGCGMTRAFSSLLRLDVRAAFSYHPMFWSVPILYLYFLLDKGFFPGKWGNRILLWGIGAGFLVNWLCKLW